MARGHKQSYCLRDSRRDAPVDDADAPGHFSCTRQGISAGHSDVYGAHLDCQWIDSSDVAVPGTYWIVAVVFPVFNETRYDDNTARRRVELR